MAEKLEARGGIEPPLKALQALALPLGYRAVETRKRNADSARKTAAIQIVFLLTQNLELMTYNSFYTGAAETGESWPPPPSTQLGPKFGTRVGRTEACLLQAGPAPTNANPKKLLGQRAEAATVDCAERVSFTMGAPTRLPHSVQEPS